MLDLAIIGGGPAAFSAAIYAARSGLKVKVFEKNNFGGTLALIDHIENYPGFLGAGQELAERMRTQALQLGAEADYGECTEIEKSENGFRLAVDGNTVESRAVLIASGSEPKQLSFEPSIPVSYCAICDGALVKDKNIVVIGGANSAVQESIYLAGLAKKVTLITHSQLKADSELQQRIKQLSNVEIIEHVEPTPEIINQYDHCFVYIGKIPSTGFLAKIAESYTILSYDDYVMTDTDNPEFPLQTVVDGLFAAGDVRDHSTKQVITAAAEGAEAALEIVKYLQK